MEVIFEALLEAWPIFLENFGVTIEVNQIQLDAVPGNAVFSDQLGMGGFIPEADSMVVLLASEWNQAQGKQGDVILLDGKTFRIVKIQSNPVTPFVSLTLQTVEK